MSLQKQLKDVNSPRQAMWLGNFMRVFPLLAIAGLLAGGVQGLIVAAAASVLAAFCSEFLADTISGLSVNTLFGFGRRTANLRERLAGELSQARFHKMQQNHDRAMAKLESYLACDPDCPEALFLKAQVLWEGYRDCAAARECLLRVIKAEPDKEAVFHRWAMNMYLEINT